MRDWSASLDAWKTRADDDAPDRSPSRATKYVCIEPGCGWAGWKALEHHRQSRHHRIVLRDCPHWGPVRFGCCHELAEPAEANSALSTEGERS